MKCLNRPPNHSLARRATPVQAWDCFTDDGADSEQNQQWVFTCPAEGDCGNQV